jgi:hypothetical protein
MAGRRVGRKIERLKARGFGGRQAFAKAMSMGRRGRLSPRGRYRRA